MSTESNNPSFWDNTKGFVSGVLKGGRKAGKFVSGGAGAFFGVKSMYNLITGNIEGAVGDAIGATLGLVGYFLLDYSDRLSPDHVKNMVMDQLRKSHPDLTPEQVVLAYRTAASQVIQDAGKVEINGMKLEDSAEWEQALNALKGGNEDPLIELLQEHAPDHAKELSSPTAMIARIKSVQQGDKPSITKKTKPSLSKKSKRELTPPPAEDEDDRAGHIKLQLPGIGNFQAEIEDIEQLQHFVESIGERFTTAEGVQPADGEPAKKELVNS